MEVLGARWGIALRMSSNLRTDVVPDLEVHGHEALHADLSAETWMRSYGKHLILRPYFPPLIRKEDHLSEEARLRPLGIGEQLLQRIHGASHPLTREFERL